MRFPYHRIAAAIFAAMTLLAVGPSAKSLELGNLNELSAEKLLEKKELVIAEAKALENELFLFNVYPTPYDFYCSPPLKPSKAERRVALNALKRRVADFQAIAKRYEDTVRQAQYGVVSGPQFAKMDPPFDERRFFRDLNIELEFLTQASESLTKALEAEPVKTCSAEGTPVTEEPLPAPPVPREAYLGGLYRPDPPPRLEELHGPFCSYAEQRAAVDSALAQWRRQADRWLEAQAYANKVAARLEVGKAQNDARKVEVLEEELAVARKRLEEHRRALDRADTIHKAVTGADVVNCGLSAPIEGFTRPDAPDVELVKPAAEYCTARERNQVEEALWAREREASRQFRDADSYLTKVVRRRQALEDSANPDLQLAARLKSEEEWARAYRQRKSAIHDAVTVAVADFSATAKVVDCSHRTPAAPEPRGEPQPMPSPVPAVGCRTPADERRMAELTTELKILREQQGPLSREFVALHNSIGALERGRGRKPGPHDMTLDQQRKRLAEVRAELRALDAQREVLLGELYWLRQKQPCPPPGTGGSCPPAGPLSGGASDGPAAETCKSAGPVRCEPRTQEKSK